MFDFFCRFLSFYLSGTEGNIPPFFKAPKTKKTVKKTAANTYFLWHWQLIQYLIA